MEDAEATANARMDMTLRANGDLDEDEEPGVAPPYQRLGQH